MGIRLGAPLERAGIQPCDASNEVPGRVSTTTLCFHPLATLNRPERTFYTVHNAPDLGAGSQRVVLDVAYGQDDHQVRIHFSHRDPRRYVSALDVLEGARSEGEEGRARGGKRQVADTAADYAIFDPVQLAKKLAQLENQMFKHAQNLEFEEAAKLRDEIQRLRASGLVSPV